MNFIQNENLCEEENSLKKIKSKIKTFSVKKKLPSKKNLFDLIKSVNEILQNEICDYRAPIDFTENVPGSLLDFSNTSKKNKTDIIVIPDLHARKNFIYKILNFVPNKNSDEKSSGVFNNSTCTQSTKKNIFDLILENKITLIFLGDIMHSEKAQKERWLNAFEEYKNGNIFSDSMKDEMVDSISTLMQVLLLKKYFSKNVHILKGNHENIKNESENGNFSFRKFVQEGQMTYDFFDFYYGEKIINQISSFEDLLPLAAIFPQVMISHAEPIHFFSKNQIINASLNPEVIEGLTWTQNDQAKLGDVKKMLDENCSKEFTNSTFQNAKYITGHRPIKEKFALRQNGTLVQIHNPKKMQFAYIKKDCTFNPEHDIIEVF